MGQPSSKNRNANTKKCCEGFEEDTEDLEVLASMGLPTGFTNGGVP